MKSVLITGASRGIGAAAVRLFAEKGYRVAFTYLHSEEAAQALAAETGALAILADSRSEEDVLRAVARATEAFGGIGVLVNNAGISSFRLMTDLSLAEWRDTMAVNLDAAFLYAREVLKDMLHRHEGRIVNVSSMWGLVGASCEVHYSAAKAGLIGLTRALAKEVGPSGITVNAVAPGVIETDMNRSLDEESLAALREETPLGRMGTPEEVAKAIYYLASDAAAFVTGEVLNISGGFVI